MTPAENCVCVAKHHFIFSPILLKPMKTKNIILFITFSEQEGLGVNEYIFKGKLWFILDITYDVVRQQESIEILEEVHCRSEMPMPCTSYF